MMKIKHISFKQLTHNGNTALNLHYALKNARADGTEKLIVEKGVYEIDPLFASQQNLSISNHGYNGPKRIAVLIEDMENFEIDFSGSTFVINGIMTPIAILNSRNISIRNLKLKNPTVPLLQCRVIAHGDDFVDAENIRGMEQMTILNNVILAQYPESLNSLLNHNIEFDGTTGEISHGTGDIVLGAPSDELFFEALSDSRLRISNIKRKPPVGNILVFSGLLRVGAAIFCHCSESLNFENIDIFSCYGMGFLAQLCKDIILNSFNTVREDGLYATAGADATHFVSCTGLIKVENCSFVGQMDDALNIHGMYTRIIDKGDDWVIVREMSDMATGIPLCRNGDTMQAIPADTLLPYTQKTVRNSEIINDTCVKIFFEENVDDIQIDDNLENTTLNADLIFRKNIVRDNRARGMLIATSGKVLIEDCFFHTSGTAIKFESDGEIYFESGGTHDVTIRNNIFDGCMHGNWGNAVIECQPRNKTEDNRYFHGTICINENIFRNNKKQTAIIDNTENLQFLDNCIEDDTHSLTLTHVKNNQIQNGICVR